MEQVSFYASTGLLALSLPRAQRKWAARVVPRASRLIGVASPGGPTFACREFYEIGSGASADIYGTEGYLASIRVQRRRGGRSFQLLSDRGQVACLTESFVGGLRVRGFGVGGNIVWNLEWRGGSCSYGPNKSIPLVLHSPRLTMRRRFPWRSIGTLRRSRHRTDVDQDYALTTLFVGLHAVSHSKWKSEAS